MIEYIKKLLLNIWSVVLPPQEVRVAFATKRLASKDSKKFWKEIYKNIFANADICMLIRMERFCDENNRPQKTQSDYRLSEYEVMQNGVKEQLFQIITSKKEQYGYRSTYTFRINPVVFTKFKKEFNKHGRCRLNGINKDALKCP